jgi:spore germination cell wall hydrolase CwlJ-like protein
MTLRWNLFANRMTTSATAVAAALVIAASASAGWIFASSPAAADDSVTIPLAKAAVLVDATSGEASVEMQATGEQAKLINAALPFGTGPVASARPFYVSGDALDSSRALLCLTQAVYYEAGYEPAAGRRAVAQVVLNRLRHPAFPKSLCGVVYQRSASGICQFTFVCDGALNRAPELGAWRQARAIAEAALDGYVERSVGEATHYHADYVAPRWAPLLTKVSQIGAHIFYRWPGAWGQPSAFVGRYIGEPRDPAALRPPQMVLAAAPVDGEVAAFAGPPVSRAPNDVGGLLDTSKGWTLNIPDPRESGSAAASIVAEQQAAKPAPIEIASAGPTVIAGR